MRTLVFLLLLANLTLFGYIRLDSMTGGEGVRLAQQVQPEKISLLTPGRSRRSTRPKVATLADVCVEWGPLSDTEKTRALATLEPLDLARLISEKRVEVIANYWVFIPPAASRAAADRKLAELKAQRGEGPAPDRRRPATLRDIAGRVPRRSGRKRVLPSWRPGRQGSASRSSRAIGAADRARRA